jgi:hypothetical protein
MSKISAALIVAACLGCGSAPPEQAAQPPAKKEAPQVDPKLQVTISSSADGSAQPVIFWMPPGAAAQESGPRVAWVPITDLAAWHAFSRQQGNRYAGMMEACFGGPPDTPERVAE